MRSSSSFVLPLALLGFLVSVGTANACSCIERSAAEVYADSDAVFLGTVTRVEKGEFEDRVTFRIDQSWKGNGGQTVTLTTAADSATCGIDFTEGEQTPVFADSDNKGGLRASLCSNIFNENPMTYLEGLSEGGEEQSFADVTPSHPQFEAITYVRAQGIVKGYEDGTFRASNPINRAEFTKMLAGVLYTPEQMQSCLSTNGSRFPDVPQSAWFAGYVCPFAGDGIIQGYPNGTYGPDKNINAAESAKIIARAFHLQASATSPQEEWWQPYIRALQERSALFVSYRSASQLLTRGDLAEILFKLKVTAL